MHIEITKYSIINIFFKCNIKFVFFCVGNSLMLIIKLLTTVSRMPFYINFIRIDIATMMVLISYFPNALLLFLVLSLWFMRDLQLANKQRTALRVLQLSGH